jgi:holo-[acyl-carrier protein] synthase
VYLASPEALVGGVVIGIGTDLVELARFRTAMARTPGLVERVFTEDERAYAELRTDPTERFAARFAAKEAVLKAMGAGIGDCALREIEVVRAESGAPSVRLHGKAATLAGERGIGSWLLTLTHTESLAQAIAVALP